jgi:hypothetical protein
VIDARLDDVRDDRLNPPSPPRLIYPNPLMKKFSISPEYSTLSLRISRSLHVHRDTFFAAGAQWVPGSNSANATKHSDCQSKEYVLPYATRGNF